MVTLSKFSSSIDYVDKMFLNRWNNYWDMTIFAVSLFVLTTFIWIAFKIYNDKIKKSSKQVKISNSLKNK